MVGLTIPSFQPTCIAKRPSMQNVKVTPVRYAGALEASQGQGGSHQATSGQRYSISGAFRSRPLHR
jgi:hypothetical protein